MAMSFVATLPPPIFGRANSLPFSLIAPGVMRSLRNAAFSTSLFSATRSPLTAAPAASLPVNVKTGISYLRLTGETCSLLRGCGCARFRSGRGGATVDDVCQFVRHRRPRHRGLQSDLLREIELRQRLIEGLH